VSRELVWGVLAFGALPLWLLAGAADWLCHRRTRIASTSGPKESVFHMILYAEIAVPLLLGLWLEINAGLLALMAVGVLAHLLTSLRDSSYAQPVRYISPLEQQVHSWLEMLPVFALALVSLLHVDAFADPRWAPALRRDAAPLFSRVAIPLALAAGFALVIEEYLRGARVRAARKA
jgi:hypothetical protein